MNTKYKLLLIWNNNKQLLDENFGKQFLWRHLAADYTITMWRTLKVTGYHVMYKRGA